MPITTLPPGDNLLATYEASLKDFQPAYQQLAEGVHVLAAIDRSKSTGSGSSIHLPTSILSLRDAAAGGPLSAAKLSGCRFYAARPDGTAISCEMTNPTAPETVKLRNVVEGDIPKMFLELIHHPPDFAAIQAGQFEAHLLVISGLFVEALWLKSMGGGEDYLIPVVSFYPELLAQPVLSEGEFLGLIKPLAQARLANYESAQSADPGNNLIP